MGWNLPSVSQQITHTLTQLSLSGFIYINSQKRKSRWFVCLSKGAQHWFSEFWVFWQPNREKVLKVLACKLLSVQTLEMLPFSATVGRLMNEAARGIFFKKQRSNMASLKFSLVMLCCLFCQKFDFCFLMLQEWKVFALCHVCACVLFLRIKHSLGWFCIWNIEEFICKKTEQNHLKEIWIY